VLFTNESDRLNFNHAAFFTYDVYNRKMKRTPNLIQLVPPYLVPYGSVNYTHNIPAIPAKLLDSKYYSSEGDIQDTFLDEMAKGNESWTPFSELNDILQLP